MKLQEIKDAVNNGETVYCGTKAYVVIKDDKGQFLIKCTMNGSCIGLVWNDGVTMNDDESAFFTDSLEKEFEDWKMMFEFAYPDSPIKKWLNPGTFINTFSGCWISLMELVEKVEDMSTESGCLRYNVIIEQCWCDVVDNETSDSIAKGDRDTKMEAVYDAMVQFVKHYNS